MLYIASQLTYLAVVANFGSIFTVLICFAAMVLFIRQFRLHEFEPLTASSVVRVPQQVHEKLMNRVVLPFSLTIGKLDVNKSGSHQQLILHSTSQYPCLLIAFGDISDEKIHSLIYQPWEQFMERLKSDVKTWPNLHIYSTEEAHKSKAFEIDSALSDKPRSTYALVVIQTKISETQNEDKEQMPAQTDAGAVISLIHVPDSYCKHPATLLSQYLKFKDGRVCNLKPLYTTEERNNGGKLNEDNQEQIRRDTGNTNCVVCWTSPANLVLLPCRHACLCFNCFKRVDNCPVCRSRVRSFFLV